MIEKDLIHRDLSNDEIIYNSLGGYQNFIEADRFRNSLPDNARLHWAVTIDSKVWIETGHSEADKQEANKIAVVENIAAKERGDLPLYGTVFLETGKEYEHLFWDVSVVHIHPRLP